MTKEETRKFAEVMLAWADGEEIEFRQREDEGGVWNAIQKPSWDWILNEYRIKSKPGYRPFANQDECWNEMQKHQPFGWVKSIDKDDCWGFFEHISYLDRRVCAIGAGSCEDGVCESYEVYFNEYVFVDGSPFGVKEEE